MSPSDQQEHDSSSSSDRLSRRQLFPLVGVAAVAALAQASIANAADGAPSLAYAELLGSQTGTLTGSHGGSFAIYQISRPSNASVTLTLSYAPFDATWANGIGFNVFQAGKKIASVTAQKTVPSPSASFTPSASGGPVVVQVLNYSPSTIGFTLTSTLATPFVSGTAAKALFVYVGTDTAGIHVYTMNPANAALTPVQAVSSDTPTFVAIDPQMRFLYCTNTLGTIGGPPVGKVSAFAIDATTGMLTYLNSQPTNGTIPAHLSVHPAGQFLLASNYGSGTFPVYPIRADGSLGPMSDMPNETGKGPNLARQEGPHAHAITMDPQGINVFGVDLGDDKIFVWQLDTKTGKLVPNWLPYAQVASGIGPRHIAFHSNGKWAYVLGEMSSSVTAFNYDATKGALSWMQTLSSVPPDFTGLKWSAEIVVHPNGRFLYGSNRTHDSIAIFAIDQNTGMLSLVGWQSTLGKTPRNFNIDPSGTFLIDANEQGDNIVSFAIDPSTGKLTPTGQVTQVPSPVCVVFGRVVPG